MEENKEALPSPPRGKEDNIDSESDAEIFSLDPGNKKNKQRRLVRVSITAGRAGVGSGLAALAIWRASVPHVFPFVILLA